MSKGSTAPAITSPLLAWPARPTPRSTPLATPATATFESFDYPAQSSPSPKGKERAEIMDHGVEEDLGTSESTGRRTYRPPTKPLSPAQLGRIAQSFGIEVPSLPTPPASGSQLSPARSISPSLSTTSTPTRSSPCLLTVVPPISLLPPSTSANSEQSLKRWRRGRLLPLQPTIGSMLLAIAREYGLPSTKGIHLYLVHPGHRFSVSSSSTSDISDEPGPRISASTWTSLFASQVASASRTSTPTGSPHRLGTLLGRDRDQLPRSPLSPFSDVMPNPNRKDLLHSSSSSNLPTSVKPFSDGLILPPTPLSLQSSSSTGSPVTATIEFDVDPEEANWLADFQATSRRRNLSTASDGGVRQLHLVAKTSDSRPRFLQELDLNTSSDGYTPTSEEGSFAIRSPDDTDTSIDYAEVTLPSSSENELLAPLELRKDLLIAAAVDKRGSGIVLGEQLDDLERVMRQLSPKEIRLTSPRVLTPRMAAKVANLQFPPPPQPAPRATAAPRPAKSPLVNSFTDPTDSDGSPRAPDDTHVTPDPSTRSAWPAVPYARSSESPGSPQIDEYFRPPTRPSGESGRKSSFSDETMRRMAAERENEEQAAKPLSTEWKPRRPARPPSPNLQAHSHSRNLSHSLSPELVQNLRSPPMTSPRSPETESKQVKRSNSISLKGLRASMSSRNSTASSQRRKTGHDEPMPAEPVGLFKQPIESSSSFPGLDNRPSATSVVSPAMSEFGSIDLNSPLPDTSASATASLPTKQQQPQQASGMRRLFGGSLPFKNRSSSDSQRSSMKSRRNPSQDGSFTISPPIPESFHKVDHHLSNVLMQPPPPPSLSPPRHQPGSPSSPRNLRRKPVPGEPDVQQRPGVPPSVSFTSVSSFVLEDPPKRRNRGQGEYR